MEKRKKKRNNYHQLTEAAVSTVGQSQSCSNMYIIYYFIFYIYIYIYKLRITRIADREQRNIINFLLYIFLYIYIYKGIILDFKEIVLNFTENVFGAL